LFKISARREFLLKIIAREVSTTDNKKDGRYFWYIFTVKEPFSKDKKEI